VRCQVRISTSVSAALAAEIFRRYPRREWGTFLECGWTEADGELVITIQSFRQPRPGDLDVNLAIFGVNSVFTERVALAAEQSDLAVGVVHSHPQDYPCFPSALDDDMDAYFSKYFASFAPNRPYVSVIFSKSADGTLHFSGRVWWRDKWLVADKVSLVGQNLKRVWSDNIVLPAPPGTILARLGRLQDGLGKIAATRLWNATVAVIGASGTGSPLIHSLARSCVGRIIIIEPQALDYSNAERIHGVLETDLSQVPPPSKASISRRLVEGINSEIEVITYMGNARDPKAQALLAIADVILGCTDTEHGRLLVSDLATRLLIPAIQINVAMETNIHGNLTGEIVHFTKYGPGLPCAYCRCQIDVQLLSQELMHPKERAARQADAAAAPGAGYWKREPVIATIGSLTTFAAELATNAVVGLLSESYTLPFTFLELNLLAPRLGAVEAEYGPLKFCQCTVREGLASQAEPWLGGTNLRKEGLT
jgi:hypothetical protein